MIPGKEVFLVAYCWQPELDEAWSIDTVRRDGQAARVRRDALRSQGFTAEAYRVVKVATL
jgi:hypothetical protein